MKAWIIRQLTHARNFYRAQRLLYHLLEAIDLRRRAISIELAYLRRGVQLSKSGMSADLRRKILDERLRELEGMRLELTRGRQS
jgi:hypothetical protein